MSQDFYKTSGNPNLIGISVLFRALSDTDRGQALALLSSQRYAPHLDAIPDVFAIIPTTATLDQSDNIARAMLSKVASNLTSANLSGDYSDVIPGPLMVSAEGDVFAGDADKQTTTTFKIPSSPIASAVSFIRDTASGRIPEDLVGSLNGYPTTPEGKYTNLKLNPATGDQPYAGDDSDPLEGGFLSKMKGIAKKAVSIGASLANNPIASAALSIVPGGGAVLKGVQLANKVMSSGLGSVAGGLLNKLGGAGKIGSLISKVAGAAGSTPGGLAKSAGLASALATPSKPAPSNATMNQVLNSPNLLETLDATFGPDKVNDAFMHILAAEGDFVDDVMSGKVMSGPSAYDPGVADLAEGDWTDNVQKMLASTTEGFQQYLDKTKAAGSSAYSKLDPKMQQFLNDNWGKIAAGTGAVAASAALYAGASKVMKDKEAAARMRVLQAKLDASKAAAEKQRKSLELAKKNKAKKTTIMPVATRDAMPDVGGSVLPPIDTSVNPVSLGTPVADGAPQTMEVTARFIKVPFAGTVMSDLEGEGARLLKDMKSALLSVNPGFLSGDVPNMSYESYGATFITHGFPIGQVSVIYSSDIPELEREKSIGAKITSPYLTRRIIEAALKVTDPGQLNDQIMVRDASGKFVPYSSVPVVMSAPIADKALDRRYARHMPRLLQANVSAGTADRTAMAKSVSAISNL